MDFTDGNYLKTDQFRSSGPEVFCKKTVLRKFTGKHLCQSLFLNFRPEACNFIKKETLVQVASLSTSLLGYKNTRYASIFDTHSQKRARSYYFRINNRVVKSFFMKVVVVGGRLSKNVGHYSWLTAKKKQKQKTKKKALAKTL